MPDQRRTAHLVTKATAWLSPLERFSWQAALYVALVLITSLPPSTMDTLGHGVRKTAFGLDMLLIAVAVGVVARLSARHRGTLAGTTAG